MKSYSTKLKEEKMEKKKLNAKYGKAKEPQQRKNLELLSEANGITLLRDKDTGKVYAVRDNGILGFKLEEL